MTKISCNTHRKGMKIHLTTEILLNGRMGIDIKKGEFRPNNHMSEAMVRRDWLHYNFGSFDGENQAKSGLQKAIRVVQFMDGSGLKPSKRSFYGRRKAGMSRLDCRIPKGDHGSSWVDPITNTCLQMDEPYFHEGKNEANRKDWAQRFGFIIHRLPWGGTWAPDNPYSICDLVTKTECEEVALRVIEDMRRYQNGFLATEAKWTVHPGWL